MYNINSPIIQQLIANTPSGGMGNMQFYNGPAPRVETVPMPSPQMSQQPSLINTSPYPDPYTMITGIGMQNYYPTGGYMPPVYNSGIAQNIYRDINQPVQGGLPIQGYSNPYMGVGMSYGPGYFQSTYVSQEDQDARSRGFDSAAEEMVNNFNISKMLSKAAMYGCKYDKEYIDKVIDYKDKEFSKTIDEFKEKRKNPYNPLSLNNYSSGGAPKKSTMVVSIVKGGEILTKYDPKYREPRVINHNRIATVIINSEVRQREEEFRRYNMHVMHMNAIERQLDNEDIIEFFNHGINVIHHRDKVAEWDSIMRNSKRLYDSEEFKRRLYANYGSPQAKARYAREEARKKRRLDEIKKRNSEKGLIDASSMMEAAGMSKAVASAFKIDPETGKLTITLPEEIEAKMDDKPLIKGTSLEREYNERMNNIDNKIDEFLEEFTPKVSTPTYYSPTISQGYSALLGSTVGNQEAYEGHYRRCKEAFLREVNRI